MLSAPVVETAAAATSAPGTSAALGSDPGSVAPVQAAATPPVSFAVQAAELGIQLPETATDADVFAAMQSRMREMAPLAGYAQSLLPHADQINEFFSSRGEPKPVEQPKPEEWNLDSHFNKAWPAPQLTQDMQFALQNGMVQRDTDTGLMVAKPGFEIMVTPLLAGMNQAINWERDQVREHFSGNPYRKTFEAIKDPVERLVAQKIEERLAAMSQQTQAQREINEFEARNVDFLYQKSATGEPMLTPQGAQLIGLAKQLRDSGIWQGDNATLLAHCRAIVANTAPVQPAAATPAGTPTPVIVPAATAAPAKHAAPDKRQSFLDTALRTASASSANAANTQTGAVVVTQPELANFFSRAIGGASA